jgi:hypothetical protein
LTVVVEGDRAVGLEYPTGHPVSRGVLCAKGKAALLPDQRTVLRSARTRRMGRKMPLSCSMAVARDARAAEQLNGAEPV